MNNKFFVDLPWDNSKLDNVKPNFSFAKSVMHKVANDLESKNLFEAYTEIFEQQISDGILEELDLEKLCIENHILIPHRPVIKEESRCTTKIRPVLNCSLKISTNNSLNEASYIGVDLLNNLLNLLLKIRIDPIIMVADICKAFLQIRLSSELDKNRFSILWQNRDGTLRAMRYLTLTFGLAASPFVLNYVILYHLNKYPEDICNESLKKVFYVDNLFIVGSCEKSMRKIYNQCVIRMSEGDF